MPNSRKDFEHNIYLLSEKMELGHVNITKSSIRTIKGISNARYAPNGRVNLNTIDQMARLMVNTVSNMMQHKHKTSEDDEE